MTCGQRQVHPAECYREDGYPGAELRAGGCGPGLVPASSLEGSVRHMGPPMVADSWTGKRGPVAGCDADAVRLRWRAATHTRPRMETSPTTG